MSPFLWVLWEPLTVSRKSAASSGESLLISIILCARHERRFNRNDMAR